MLENVKEILCAAIEIPDHHRVVDPVGVRALAENITDNGLLSAIDVLQLEEGKYRLIYGAHRLEAYRLLGRSEIAANVHDISSFADESAIQLRTISENFVRRELTMLDRAVDIATWCDIYRAAHTNIRPGRKGKELSPNFGLNSLSPEEQETLTEQFTKTFSEAAQQAFRINRSAVFVSMKIASIPHDLRQKIALYPIADNQRELEALAKEPANRQEQIIKIILDDDNHISSVSDAIAVIDRQPPAPKEERYQKVSASFSQMKQSEQYRFFDLHEDLIAKWQADNRKEVA